MNSSNLKTIIITGPTAVGKSNTALIVAEELGLEIISADSLQVYKELNIGTSKPSKAERAQVPHHCINIVKPDEEFNANLFAKTAKRLQAENQAKGKHTLICGGTGLFIEAFLYNFDCSIPADEKIREEITKLLEEKGIEKLFTLLQEKDPEYAARITTGDRQKLIRALEVEQITGKPFSSFHRNKLEMQLDPSVLYIVLTQERKKLYERINARVDQMMKEGLYEEVISLLEKGYERDLKSLKSIGYRELIACHFGEISRDEAIEKIKQHSRKLAKRQFTWHRRHKEAISIDIDEQNPVEVILKLISEDA